MDGQMTHVRYEVCDDVLAEAQVFVDQLSDLLKAEFGPAGFQIELVQDYISGDENGWRISAFVRHGAQSPKGCHTSRHHRSSFPIAYPRETAPRQP